ncbi:TRAP transporter substrate-binding protein [Campylobacter geochelonis]|uniref:TRAP transporter substrate-binding protein n=1 Tax=Campylobacter geochelonis TaxID=1780362 RepID=UPI000770AB35|nr:TRAP transporter substrate-binding protein DctP [Campylobacter geochelonis]CZE48862.1 trap-type mannitol/chloroaromatic compound transport system%2C periplasmic component [Campylobacter geochelonis]CZE50631.1 trap-type mannitol/chloroaromatic compound transport system%2C periplasmic component [Campylobacter geochelonis]
MRKFLATFLAFATAATLFASDNDKKVYRLKLATSYENTMPVLGDVVADFKKYADELSGGRLQIRIDTPTKHKAPFEVFDFVKAGQYDLAYTALYYFKGKDPKTMLWTAVPFGMNTPEQHAWFYYGGGKELSDKMFAQYNMKSIPMGSTGIQMGGWFRKEVNSLADLQGLKVRIPGFGGEVMSKLGASINTIPTGELYMALEMGTIDAVEWVSPVYDMSLGFGKVAKYYYTGWQEPTADTHLLVNNKSYEKLPKDLQLILEAAARMAGEDMLNKGFYENSRIWSQMKTQNPNIEVKSFPKDVVDGLRKATNEILDAEAAKDPMFKEILESQRAFQKIGREWYKISDFAYIQNTAE